jgi:hypothetical protein
VPDAGGITAASGVEAAAVAVAPSRDPDVGRGDVSHETSFLEGSQNHVEASLE